MNKYKVPFRVAKKTNTSKLKLIIAYLVAIAVALCLGALLLLILGVNPLEYYKSMFTIGTINNRFAYKNLEGFIKLFVPLLITSVALSLAFKMKFWNIGGEGQFIIGAISASTVALLLGDGANPLMLFVLMVLSGAITAGIYGLAVAVLKVKFGTNETLLTLMFNYIALYFLKFLGQTQGGWNFFLRQDSERPVFATFPENAWMISIKIGRFSLNISLIIAVVLCLLIYYYLSKTKHGYEISVVGDSSSTAKYAGMKVQWIVVRTIFISAALIGLSGAFYVSTAHSLSTSVTNNVGWTGIIVAWIAKLNTIGIFIATILITVLQYGCTVAAADFTGIDSNFASLLQGCVLFAVLVADFTTRFKLVRNKSLQSDKGAA